MMNRTNLIAPLLALSTVCAAQQYSLRKGDKAYQGMAYHDAIAHYQEAVQCGADTGAFIVRLAESYYNVRDFAHAAEWYSKALDGPGARAVDAYNHSQSLRALGRHEEADQWMSRYREMTEGDRRSAEQLGAIRYAAQIEAKPIAGCTVENLRDNCTHADMGTALVGDRLVFASARHAEAAARRRHAWDGDPFLDLYWAKRGEDGQLVGVEPLKDLNTRYHESNATFTADGKEVWFTRNNHTDGRTRKSTDEVVKLKIYSRIFSNGEWLVERSFPYNSDEHSTGHPALSADGKVMYFVSDMPGGQGGADIWMSRRKSESEWEKPVNLGPYVNTEGDELFPFVDATGTLYFASDGHAGIGGLDVFVSRQKQGAFGKAINAGVPINSRDDDFALVLDGSGLKGYLTSNRSGGMGGDDLYKFDLRKPLGASMKVSGAITDRANGTPVVGKVVLLKDALGKVVGEVTTDGTGAYSFELEEEKRYTIASEEGAYRAAETAVATGGLTDTVIVRDLALAKLSEVFLWAAVTDAKTKASLGDVSVNITDVRSGAGIALGRTEPTGEFFANLKNMSVGDSMVFRVDLNKQGYAPKSGLLVRKVDRAGKVVLSESMDLSLQPIDVGTDLAEVIDIKPIYFDLGKSAIRKDAAEELDKIVAVMQENPGMIIELGSHTDSRGSDKSNLALSDKRAKSSAAYIVSKGIAKERITGKGYGETKLLNKCANKVKCAEDEHALNRRTEFIIVKM